MSAYDHDYGPEIREEKCEECAGKGVVYFFTPLFDSTQRDSCDCKVCNGAGYVDVKKLTREEYSEKYQEGA